jgi:hypothetical protein
LGVEAERACRCASGRIRGSTTQSVVSRLRIRDLISVRIRDRYEGGEQVTCVIPGHDRVGEQPVADEFVVEDGALAFNYRGVCGYGSTLDYAG